MSENDVDPQIDLLAVGPHPDDVELFCGGTVARTVRQGHTVALVDLTRGEAASRGTPELRAEEAAAAASILGVAERRNLGIPDAGIRCDAAAPGDDAYTARLVSVLRELRPRVVLAPWREARHPDHAAAATLVERAVFLAALRSYRPQLGDRHRVSRVLSYPIRVVPQLSFLVDISEVAEVKEQAIAAYGSQVKPDPNAAPTLVGSAGSLDSLRARDAYLGAQLGVARAEGFVVRDAVPVDDVVAHFGDRPEPYFSGGAS